MAKINQREAAKYTGLPERSLEGHRLRGTGPPFYKIGQRVIYDTLELDAWLSAHRRVSTYDPGPSESSAA